MNIIQGFVKIPKLSDNAPNKVAPFGELSPISLTFSRNIKYFALPDTNPDVELVTFKTVNSVDEDIDVPDAISTIMITLSDWVYTQSVNKAIPEDANITAFKQSITSEFSNVINSYGLEVPIYNVNVGEILNTPIGGERMPDYISFQFNDNGKEYSFKLWFNDSRFQLQYLYYDIVVLPPVGVIDSLNDTTAQVSTILSGVSKSQIINQTNTVTQDNPATRLYPITLRWHNPENSTSVLDTEWVAVIYGKAGIDNDAVKDAIRTYISTNSGLTNWTSIYPDLYAESEFIIIPFWDQLATPENGYDEGLYKSIVSKDDLARIEQQKVPVSYNSVTDFEAYKNEHLMVGASSYRCIMFYTLGNPNNTGGKFNLGLLYPDYMNISTSSPDFSRLTRRTQDFVIQLNEALHKAREYTREKPLPVGYALSIKANREYLGFDYDGYTFYIQTRLGYMKNN